MPLDDNPFAASDSDRARAGTTDTMEPVAMDVIPILERCWQLFTSNPLVVIGAILIPIGPAVVAGVADAAMQIAAEESHDENTILGLTAARLAVKIVNLVIGLFFQLGAIQIFLALASGAEAEIGMLVSGGRYFLRGMLASLGVGVATLLGLLLLIIPGIVIGIGLQFTLYALVDKDMDPLDAIQESWRLTDGYKLTIFLVNLAIGILGLVFSCVTLGFGYFLIVPVLSLTAAVMYHSLKHLRAGAI